MSLWLWQQGVFAAESNAWFGRLLPGYAWAQQFPESANIVRNYLKEKT